MSGLGQMPTDFQQMTAVPSQGQHTILTHSSATIIPPPGMQLRPGMNTQIPAPFPMQFAHPELLKHPFLPYDLASLHAAQNARPMHPMPSHFRPDTLATSIPVSTHNSSHVSPTPSRPSTSSPQSSPHSDNLKMNSSIGTIDTDQSDDEETIDVVKSAFVPILRPSPSGRSIVGAADSTTLTEQMESPKIKCELKAPSSRKPVHETAPRIEPTGTLIKPITNNTAQAKYWRPY